MAAAKNNHSEVVDALLKKGAEVDLARDVSDITCIYHGIDGQLDFRKEPQLYKLQVTTEATLQ